MASVIQAGTASNTALTLTSDTSGELQLKTNNGSTTALTLTTGGNINIPTTGARITGDFSNATIANRVAFQSSTTNGNTFLGSIPNGSGTLSGYFAYNSSDTANAAQFGLFVNGTTDAQIRAALTGTGTYLPITMLTGGSERLRIDTSGKVGIGTTTMTNLLNVAGAIQSSSTLVAVDANTVALSQEAGYGRVAAFGPNSSTGGTLYLYSISSNGSVQNGVVIDSSGNVGIGTSSPTKLLSVYKIQNAETSILVQNTSTGSAAKAIIRFGNDNGENVGSVGALGSGFTPSGALEADGFYVDAARQSLNLSSSNNGIIKFFGAGTERMRIDSSGNLFLGATTSALNSTRFLSFQDTNASAITARCTSTSQGSDVLLVRASRNTTNASYAAITYYNDGAAAYRFYVADSGNVTNTNGSYGTISDAKLKENIVDATPKLDKVNQLKVRNFNLIGDDLKQIGFVAQEFEQVFPSMVEESQDRTPDGEMLGTTTKTIKTTVLIPILVKAIQELKAELDATKAEVAALKGVN